MVVLSVWITLIERSPLDTYLSRGLFGEIYALKIDGQSLTSFKINDLRESVGRYSVRFEILEFRPDEVPAGLGL